MMNKKLKRRLLDISIVLIMITAILCIIMAVISYSEYKRGNDAYLDAAGSFLSTEPAGETETQNTELVSAETVVITAETADPDETETHIESEENPAATTARAKPAAGDQPTGKISVDFNALKAVNSDIAAWIISEGTLISYPIAASDSEEDYDYYISHLFNGIKNKLGTLFTDARNVPFKENNTIIYGHNMLNGTMFSSLLNYRQQSYYDNHPVMQLYTPESNYKILIFSGYMTTDKSDAYVLNLTGDGFAAYIKKAIENSNFKAGFTPTQGDKLITLSTCDNQTSEKRYVIHGILIPE